MALIESNMLELGTKAFPFQLPDTVSGKILTLDDMKSDKGTVIMFICNHCPYVIHIRDIMVEIAKEYKAKGISLKFSILILKRKYKNYYQSSSGR